MAILGWGPNQFTGEDPRPIGFTAVWICINWDKNPDWLRLDPFPLGWDPHPALEVDSLI